MATREQIVALAGGIARYEVAVDFVDWTDFNADEKDTVMMLATYEVRLHARKDNRKAMRLLRTWLSDHQTADLRRLGWFYVRGSDGGMYRLRPHVAHVEKVERHGKNWFGKFRYCFHDEGAVLPPADVTLAHVLHLVTDEADFLARANATVQGADMWDGNYRRRLRAARLRREGQQDHDGGQQWSTPGGHRGAGDGESRDVERMSGVSSSMAGRDDDAGRFAPLHDLSSVREEASA